MGVRVFVLAEFKFVFFSLDGGYIWIFAVDKETKDMSWQRQVELVRGVERKMSGRGTEAAAFWALLFEHMDNPMVVSEKSWLFCYLRKGYWLEERRMQMHVPRIISAELLPQTEKSGGRSWTKKTCQLFTEYTLDLVQLSRQHEPERVHLSKVWYRQSRTQATELQFSSLFAFIRDEVVHLGVRAIIVEHAELLDSLPLDRLMDVRK